MVRKKKRIRIKYKNIFKLLMFILFIVLIIFTINKVLYIKNQNKIFNDIKRDTLTINTNKKYLKLNNSNLEYIKKTDVKVTIKNKNYSYVIKNDVLTNKTYIKLNTYKKRINDNDFNHSYALFVDDDKIRNDTSLTIKLPRKLKDKNVLDVYYYNSKYYLTSPKTKVKNEEVTFTVDNSKDKYLVTFVKLKDIEVNNSMKIMKNNNASLDIKFYPKNATIKDYTFKGIDKKYINIVKDRVYALNDGTTSFKIVSGDNKIVKEIKVNIDSKKYNIEYKNGIYYIDGIMLVNKTYPIKKDYDPKELLPTAKKAYEKMKSDASKDGINLWIVSGYRSYDTQVTIYNNYVKSSSKEKADTFSARPGYSEHQTGYSMDLNDATSNFNNTKEAKWLQDNSYKYGFIIRFPKGKEKYTGYKYEPWHIRYVGKAKALKLYRSGLSIEEYYNLTSKYSN